MVQHMVAAHGNNTASTVLQKIMVKCGELPQLLKFNKFVFHITSFSKENLVQGWKKEKGGEGFLSLSRHVSPFSTL